MTAGIFAALVLLITLALATFVSEDLTCISAGMMVGEGHISFMFAVTACFLGIFAGDMLLFLAGRYLGRAALNKAPLRWLVRPESLESISAWLSRNGAAAIFSSRFIPGTRLPTYFAAGLLYTSARKFIVYFLMAAALWTPLVVGISAGLIQPFLHLGFFLRQSSYVKWLIGGALIFVVMRTAMALSTYRARRGIVRFWKRLVRWEFWPPYLFYPPVVLYIIYLGIRFRSWTLFTAANPAIPASGFVGESKYEILQHLRNAAEWLPRFTFLPAAESVTRLAQTEQFMLHNGLAFPVVLKPDAGQRGSGVTIVRSPQELQEYLSRFSFPAILQEYVPGIEFGVFYYRKPDKDRGRVFSVTEKRMPVIVGDGRHSLEELILADDRAVCMSDFYQKKNYQRTQEVLPAGEKIQLVEIGTHCRGAIFLDGGYAITPALEEVIEGIARTFHGFFFGRFDIRVPTLEDFKLGRNLKVIELNGVTSEATHIYDPALSLCKAYGVLFQQWRIAFEIGARNRADGVRPTPLVELFHMIRQYRLQSREYPE